jgi:hypothetical protein
MATPTGHYQVSDLAQIGRGLYYIGEECVRPAGVGQISSNCITCKQQVWSSAGSTDGALRLSLRRSPMKGYLVSCSVPKSKQKRQLLCLGCVNKLRMGKLNLSADAESVSLCNRGHGQQDALLFERQASGSWKQTLELTNELLEAVVISNESTVSRKRPKKAAAESALNRGMQAGSRAREMLVSGDNFLVEPMRIFNATCVCHRLRPSCEIPMDSLPVMCACKKEEHKDRLHAVHGISHGPPLERRDNA